MTYRSDVDALAARTDALASEVRTKTSELETARALLDEARAKARLPILPNIRVATPCSADWNAMTPQGPDSERVRACASCNKNVYNISQLTREEAEALIVEKEGKLCVRYFQRKDGTILLADCSIGIRQKRKRRVLAAGVAALLGGGVFMAIRLDRTKIAPAPRADITDAVADPWQRTDGPSSKVEPDHSPMMGGAPATYHERKGEMTIAPSKPPHAQRPHAKK